MEAAMFRFHTANKIRGDKTVSYPTMLILPNKIFAHRKLIFLLLHNKLLIQ